MRTRKVVLVEQVHRLVQKFNKVNFVDEKKVNCKVIVDTFAGGSGILEQVSSQLKSSLKSEDFKKYEFVNVDHLNIKKSIKLDSRLDIYDGQANGGIRLANYICAPPEGGELVTFYVLGREMPRLLCVPTPSDLDQPHGSGNATKGMVG
ncbi:hypothetical protein CYMTET_31654 [Cymbomonas tetramitiformis]|uniref:Uncharacterized protein n=1 Tax=Cymbomonas tetramitiformis TaxID=36881 RepID=A0AAE0FGK4_9CHLO|nr:hypothetical protein CYMTET_31654 [Cymbomonas tetramitiformis]